MAQEESLFQNIFYDPYTAVPSGTLSIAGQPLKQLALPPIHTLVYKSPPVSGKIPLIQVKTAPGAGTPPSAQLRDMGQREGTGGIILNLNLMSTAPPPEPQINPVEVAPSQSLGRKIPSNPKEARAMLDFITGQKAGKKNEAFTLQELKQIAKNLGLPVLPGKDALANSIRNYIIELFKIPTQ